MKKLALALVFGVFSLGAVSAQTVDKLKVKKEGKVVKAEQEIKTNKGPKHEAKTPEERADRQASRMAKELNLNEAQTRQVRELSLRKAQQMQALKAKSGENKEAFKTEMKQIRDSFQADLKNVLSADQFQKYEALKAERKAKGKHGKHHNRGEHKGEYKKKTKTN